MNTIPIQSKLCCQIQFTHLSNTFAYTNSHISTHTLHKYIRQSTSNTYRLHALDKELSNTDLQSESDDSSNLNLDSDFIQIGVIGPAHGVRGEFKVQPLTDFPEDRLGEPGIRWIQAPTPKFTLRQSPSPPEEVTLQWGRSSISKGREVWLVKLEGIDSPEEASLIRGYTILIPSGDRAPLDDEDEFYVQELVGLKVYMMDTEEHIGVVVDVFDGTGTHDVLRIELRDGVVAVENTSSRNDDSDDTSSDNSTGEKNNSKKASDKLYILLPFAKPLVPFVDVQSGIMKVTPPDGWLDLAVKSTKSAPRKESMGKRERRNPRGRKTAAAEQGNSSSSSS